MTPRREGPSQAERDHWTLRRLFATGRTATGETDDESWRRCWGDGDVQIGGIAAAVRRMDAQLPLVDLRKLRPPT